MNISSVNSGYYPSTSNNHPKSNTPVQSNPTPEKTTSTANSSVNAVAPTPLSSSKTALPDLTNITPKQTYELAHNLLDSESISFDSFAQMMIIGFNHERPPGQADTSELSSAPFNLLAELNSIAEGTHDLYTSGKIADSKETKSLLELLTNMLEEQEQTGYTPIDVNV